MPLNRPQYDLLHHSIGIQMDGGMDNVSHIADIHKSILRKIYTIPTFGPGCPRQNISNPNSVFANLFPQRFAKAVKRVLRNRITPPVGIRLYAGYGTHIDDMTRFSPDHGRKYRFGEKIRAVQISLHDTVKGIRCFIHDISRDKNASIIDQNIDATKFFQNHTGERRKRSEERRVGEVW